MQPTKTETVTANFGNQVTVTEWTIGDYTLTRTALARVDGEYVDWKATADSPGWPLLSDTTPIGEAPHYGVKWSARGTVPIDAARDYAAKIMAAAAAADQFNAIIAAN